MKSIFRIFLAISMLGSAELLLAADPVVTNVRAAQKPGTKQVEIDFDLSGATSPVTVSLQASSNGGSSFTVPVTALSGDAGGNISLGRNKRIVWNAGVDWNNQFSNTMSFRVTAGDTPPAPEGFALIPAGSFQMGDQSNPLVGSSSELPVHSVYVSAFYIGKYEVTKESWDAVRAWGLNNGYTDLPVGNGSYASKGANHPVHSIDWYDMVKWCNALSQKENLTPCYMFNGAIYKIAWGDDVVCNWNVNGYRLPSEAEWEKAARGGLSGKNFPWGTDTISQSQANYKVFSSNGTTNYFSYDVTPRPPATGTQYYHPSYTAGGTPYSSPVGSFPPNGYGLYDMAGNLYEWCWDPEWSYPAGSQSDPRGPASGTLRVCRGGTWGNHSANSCRVAHRYNRYPHSGDYYIGFRIAYTSVP